MDFMFRGKFLAFLSVYQKRLEALYPSAGSRTIRKLFAAGMLGGSSAKAQRRCRYENGNEIVQKWYNRKILLRADASTKSSSEKAKELFLCRV